MPKGVIFNLSKISDLWKSLHYPPETTSIQLVVRLLATLVQASTAEIRDGLAKKVRLYITL